MYSPMKTCHFWHIFVGELGLNIETHPKQCVSMFGDARGYPLLSKTTHMGVFWCSEDGEGARWGRDMSNMPHRHI